VPRGRQRSKGHGGEPPPEGDLDLFGLTSPIHRWRPRVVLTCSLARETNRTNQEDSREALARVTLVREPFCAPSG
jgi:hypothetical protein